MSAETRESLIRVMQVHHFRYGEIKGGVDTVVSNLLEPGSGRELLFEVAPWSQRRLERRDRDGVRVYSRRLRMPAGGLKGQLAGTLEFLRTVVLLAGIVRRERVDLVHVHTLQTYQMYFVVLSLLGLCPYVVTLHRAETVHYHERPRWTRFLWRRILARAAGVNAVSDGLKALAERTFPLSGPVEAIHNGIIDPMGQLPGADYPVLAELPERYGLCVGALEEYKGHDVAIQAWAEVAAGDDSLGLVIVGEGSRRADLLARVRACGLESRVLLLGALPRATVLALVRRAEVFIMPSMNEGLGVALMEAAALERAIVCSNIPPFREIVADGVSASLFEPGDAGGLAERVARLARDSDLRRTIGRAARLAFLQGFHVDRMRAEYRRWYSSIARATSGGRRT